MFAFDSDADASVVRPAPTATLTGSALLDRLRAERVAAALRLDAEPDPLARVLAETAAQALALDADRLAVARSLGARLDRSVAAYRATIQRAFREGAAVVSWADEDGAPCAASLPQATAWRVRDGLVAQGVRARITFNCPA